MLLRVQLEGNVSYIYGWEINMTSPRTIYQLQIKVDKKLSLNYTVLVSDLYREGDIAAFWGYLTRSKDFAETLLLFNTVTIKSNKITDFLNGGNA